MAAFPVHCSFHQPCISCVDCNGAMIESPQKVTLKLFYSFSQSILSKSRVAICVHVPTLHWPTNSFAWHCWKGLVSNWKHAPSLIPCPLSLHPVSSLSPGTATSNELTIIFKPLSIRWSAYQLGERMRFILQKLNRGSCDEQEEVTRGCWMDLSVEMPNQVSSVCPDFRLQNVCVRTNQGNLFMFKGIFLPD